MILLSVKAWSHLKAPLEKDLLPTLWLLEGSVLPWLLDCGPRFLADHWQVLALSFFLCEPPHLALSEQIHEKRSQEERERERSSKMEVTVHCSFTTEVTLVTFTIFCWLEAISRSKPYSG